MLGLGASGPQVIEGFHGVPYDAPLGRTREVIEICRKVWRRESRWSTTASTTVPLPTEQGTGLGKPLKLINHPVRPASRSSRRARVRRTSSWPPRSRTAGSRFLPAREGARRSGASRSRRIRQARSRSSARSTSTPAVSSPSATTSTALLRRSRRRWPRSTSAAWAPRARTSTTSSAAATARRRRPRRSRSCTWRARSRRRPRRCPSSSSRTCR